MQSTENKKETISIADKYKDAKPKFDYSILEEGDIILKRGIGQVSTLMIKYLDEKIPLSHCGIIIKEDTSHFVIHSIAKEYTGDTFLKEFQRRTRIIARSLFGLWSQRGVLNLFKHGAFAFQMISHKLMRWLVPLALLLAFGLNGFLVGNVYYYSLWILQCVFYGLALGGSIMPRTVGKYALFYIPAHFCAMNTGAFLGLLRFLTGRRYRAWQPMSRN